MTVRRRAVLVASGLAALAALSSGGVAADGTITTVAGTIGGFAGDGELAAQARLASPQGTTIAADGSVLIADTGNNRVRRVAPNGIITTVVGDEPGSAGDGGPAVDALLDTPTDVAATADGGYLIADARNARVRKVGADGVIRTVAGTDRGFGGDGGPATAAALDNPRELAPTPDGGFLVADAGNNRIRRVSPSGIITTVAGTVRGLAGDGGPATAARLADPQGVALTGDGGFLIADAGNARVRRVAADGTISTVAGTGPGFSGDGGPATTAQLAGPADVIPLTNGGFLIADAQNNRLRRVTPLGAVFTIAGGAPGLSGDGGPASGAQLHTPSSLLPAPGGGVLVGDTANQRVRRLTDVGQVPPPELTRSIGVAPAGGDVSVRPGADGAFIPVREPDLAPQHSAVDTTAGSIALTVRRRDGVRLADALVSKGSFTMRQAFSGSAVADLTLAGPVDTCARRARASAAGARENAKARRRTRRLDIRVKGAYRTRGRYASAIARGTQWTIIDGCDRTVIRVTEGTVRVRDFRLNRFVNVKAPRTYVALARAARP
jgi:NHL repeat